ncbi:MAG: ATP-binding cassette domain-containing protein, partial [Halomonadaceae bacterium]|nr:ATP-binding cassette domain-containing protein [Halomonadaceae bacterium]
MLTLAQVNKRYPTGDLALTDIDLTLPAGQVMALIGPSGAGKSTLIRCVNRLVEPSSGSIRLEGSELTDLSPRRLRSARRTMGMIFQDQ